MHLDELKAGFGGGMGAVPTPLGISVLAGREAGTAKDGREIHVNQVGIGLGGGETSQPSSFLLGGSWTCVNALDCR